MREDRADNVRSMIEASKTAEAIKQNKVRYKIIADMMNKGSADIAGDGLIFAAVNRPRSLEDDERLSIEEYMKFYPHEVEDALYVAAQRRAENEKAYNMKSKAKWHHLGEMPVCIGNLMIEMYPNAEDRKRAFKRFFNMFPKFRISSRAI